jgi:hypothetical protein
MIATALRTRPFLRLVVGVIAFLLFVRLFAVHDPAAPKPSHGTSGKFSPAASVHVDLNPVNVDLLPCADLPGANDTVVVIKTGATELQQKLPVHLETTFRCFPNRLILSDLEENFKGQHIVDTLRWTTPDVRTSNPDFELWRRMHKGGRGAIKPEEIYEPGFTKEKAGTAKPNNPGWRLDKWKYIPMLNETLQAYPRKNWYIFMEADTYIVWSTLLAWLNSLSPEDPHYIGAQMQIEDVVFAYGGSGIVMSRKSIEMAVQNFNEAQRHWEWETQGHWAGDYMLGRLMKDTGSRLTWAWPIFQGLVPGAIHYSQEDYYKRLWCYPTVSYHHMSPEEIEDLWNWEQDWRNEVSAKHISTP